MLIFLVLDINLKSILFICIIGIIFSGMIFKEDMWYLLRLDKVKLIAILFFCERRGIMNFNDIDKKCYTRYTFGKCLRKQREELGYMG